MTRYQFLQPCRATLRRRGEVDHIGFGIGDSIYVVDNRTREQFLSDPMMDIMGYYLKHNLPILLADESEMTFDEGTNIQLRIIQ